MSKNPFIFSDMHPDKDIQDYTAEEAYELGVSTGLSSHPHKYTSVSIANWPMCICGHVIAPLDKLPTNNSKETEDA